MDSTSDKLRDITLTVRMNKYYHQVAARNFSWLDGSLSLAALSALVIGGASFVEPWFKPYLQAAIYVAGFCSLFVVVIKLSDKIRQHEALFRRFNEIEARLNEIESKLVRGEEDKKVLSQIFQEEAEFIKLEGEQPHPFPLLLRFSHQKVLGEIGHPQK